MPATAETAPITEAKVIPLSSAPTTRASVRNMVEDPSATAAGEPTRRGNRLMDRPEFASKPAPLTRTKDVMVSEAVAAMSEKNYGSVIIVDETERVIGVVTERDIMKKLVGKGLDAKTTPLSAIMTPEPRLARQTDDMIDWLRIMSNERFRRLPVVDENDRIIAVFTQGDFVSYTWPDLMYQMKSIAKATITKNFSAVTIAIGIAVYSLLIILALGLFN